MRKCVVAVVALLLTGCGASVPNNRANVSFASSADIREALNKAGLACADYETIVGNDRTVGMASAVDVAECKVDNENIYLVVWKDNGQRDNYSGMEKSMGCTMGKAFGKSTFDFVVGDRWTIDETSQTLAGKISNALGGRPEHITCSD